MSWPLPIAGLLSTAESGFMGGDLAAGSIELAAIEMLTAADMATPLAGGNLTINGEALGAYDYVVKQGNQTISSFSAASWFTTTADTRSAFIVVNGNLTIDAAQVVKPTVRKLFTVLYVDGALTINGEVSMSARGANHAATTAAAIRIATGSFSGSVTNPQVPATGGGGGAVNGVAGTAGSAGGTGGGGGGGRTSSFGPGAGAAGTSFSGGPGGGGGRAGSGTAVAGTAGGANGGAGGTGAGWTSPGASSRGGGGGAGNDGGTGGLGDVVGRNGSPGSNGTGGVLIIIATGALSGSGSCTAAGAAGGDGGSPSGSAVGGGAGSGGGSVTVICASGTVTTSATGGAGGTTSDNDGGAGGDGTARVLTPA